MGNVFMYKPPFVGLKNDTTTHYESPKCIDQSESSLIERSDWLIKYNAYYNKECE